MHTTLAILIVVALICVFLFPCTIAPIGYAAAGAIIASIVINAETENEKTGGVCSHYDFMQTFINARLGFKNEEEVRHIFNCFVNKGKFIPITGSDNGLNWLYAVDHSRRRIYLDYDGYNADANTGDGKNIAFEYNGRGHYENIYNNKVQFIRQRDNDRIKKELAAQNNVHLIIIPYTIHPRDFEDYIKSRLYDCGALKKGTQFYYLESVPEPDREHENILQNTLIVDRQNGTVGYFRAKTADNNPSPT